MKKLVSALIGVFVLMAFAASCEKDENAEYAKIETHSPDKDKDEPIGGGGN